MPGPGYKAGIGYVGTGSSKKKQKYAASAAGAKANAAAMATYYGTPTSSTTSSPSYSSSSSASTSSTSSTSAASQAAAEAAAAIKTAKAVVSEFGKDKKNPKTVSGKYAKASEKAQKQRAKSKAKVKRTTKSVQKKYASVGKAVKAVGRTDTSKKHYWEDGSAISKKKYEKTYALPKKPRRAAQRRSDTLYAKTGLPGKAPKVKPAKHPQTTDAGHEAGAWVPRTRNLIRVGSEGWGGLTGSRHNYDNNTKALLLHEFAHTKQNPKTLQSGDAEGLAERFESRMGRKLGIDSYSSPEYRAYKEVAPAKPKVVMERQFVNGNPGGPKKYRGGQSPEEYLSRQKSPSPAPKGKKYTEVPEFGPLNAYKIWEGANQIAAKAKELSKGKTGKAETEATRNAARAAAALSRAVTGREAAGPKPRKVANRLEKAVSKSQGTIPDDVPQQYRGLIADASRKYGVPAALLSAVLRQESGFDPNVGSPAGAQGIAQFMPGTAEGMGVDPYDPSSAIPGAARLLAGNKDQFGSWDLALAAYNAGGGAVSEYGGIPPYPETQNYVKTIMGAVGDMDVAAKDIPKPLKRTARQTLGKRPTKAILRGGEVIKDKNAGEETQATGKWNGSQAAALSVIPKEFWADAKGDKRTPEENASVGGSSTSDHLTTNASSYAADLPADDNLARTIAKNLGLSSHTGTNEVTKDGIRYQLIWQDEGHYDHIHLGAQVVDPSATIGDTNVPIKGTNLAVKVPTPTGTASTAGGVSTTTGGTSSTGAPVPGTPEYQQMMNEVRRRRGPSVAKRLAAIDRWMTSPVTAPTPDISQELIDRILGK